ncbi:2-succinyl-5-enolpyruvyl-6-hydroxy-3-cyclohexene-1-carboxylic-acid synthase [candidate division KSB1 bacterium]|nr:2-succinyl-5-enolpyruvyl-6-hydroxy-3-cyclohexene-1-carboxylic-acid synthase [candidate division KSB1 bacterium]
MIATENINTFWAALCIEELVRNGITFYCISPGSRSAPLTIAAAQNPQTDCHICHDERGAAYVALGYAKARGTPAALISTSGTAAANFYPAIVEAAMDAVPMIVLTADRPHELLDTGANQTIDQHHLYGRYARWSFTLPPPTTDISPRFILTTIDQAIHRSMRLPAGAVHLNCMFREPLVTPNKFSFPADAAFSRWQRNQAPFTRYRTGKLQVEDKDVSAVARTIDQSEEGLVIVGRLGRDARGIERLLDKLGWPVYADITSGLRLGRKKWPALDERLLHPTRQPDEWQISVVLHIGGALTSKAVQQWLERNPLQHYIHIHDDPRRLDAGHLLTEKYETEIGLFCQKLSKKMQDRQPSPRTDRLAKLSQLVRRRAEDEILRQSLNEPAIAHIVSRFILPHHGLLLGNSMPVRDMNLFAASDGPAVPCTANRGASGIDGAIATAVGYAHGLGRPVTLITGDIAALHDLNSLNLVRNSTMPIIIILINNDGGGIFSFLPIARHTEVEKYFQTPHGLTFEQAAAMFGLAYAQPASNAEFRDIYRDSCRREQSTIIEVRTTAEENLRLHQTVEEKIRLFIESGR